MRASPVVLFNKPAGASSLSRMNLNCSIVSTVWKVINRMESLTEEVKAIEERAEKHLQNEVLSKSSLGFMSKAGELGLDRQGLGAAMSYHLREVRSFQPLEFTTRPTMPGLTELSMGASLVVMFPITACPK